MLEQLVPGLRTRSIFNRVQVRVQQIFASRVQVRVLRILFFEFKFEFAALDFVGRSGMNK